MNEEDVLKQLKKKDEKVKKYQEIKQTEQNDEKPYKTLSYKVKNPFKGY